MIVQSTWSHKEALTELKKVITRTERFAIDSRTTKDLTRINGEVYD